jgi:glutathione synthase/RimK-type ligase-like ATP-grasp enzyme
MRLVELDLHPIVGLAALARMPAATIFNLILKTQAAPELATACMQMFYALQAVGQHEFALEMQARALQQACLFRVVAPSRPSVRLLAVMAPGDMTDNTPYEFVIENSDIRLDLLFLVPGQAPPETVPDHDVAIVAIGESAKNRSLLACAQALLANWPRPVLNRPKFIARCARDSAYRLLNDIPGLAMSPTRRVDKETVRRFRVPQFRFPITIRPIDSHGGNGLARVDADPGLDTYFERYPADKYYVSEFVDYRSEDGLYRKSRIALIDGQPYVCHLAISDTWIVHYLSSGMELSERKRAEEAALMEGFDRDFGLRHRAAFDAIADRLGLDYVVLDCTQTRDGRLLLFEADSRGWIHATDPVHVYPYKPKVMERAFAAFKAMLVQRSMPARSSSCE